MAIPNAPKYESPKIIKKLKRKKIKIRGGWCARPGRIKSVYFAHPFDLWKTELEKKIEDALEEKGYIVINPFDTESDLNEKYGVDTYYDNPSKEFAKEICERDFASIERQDIYFAYIPKGVTSIGTIREFEKALELGKRTIIVCYKPNPFLIDADELYLSLQDFIEGNEYKWTE